MKKILIILISAVVVAGFASCKRCTTCKIQRLNGTIEAEYEEYCGTPQEVDDFKKELEIKADLYLGPDGQVICIDN